MSNERGLSLVEVMIALLLLLFVSLAMMQTALVSIESNARNYLRDEAVSVGEERMSDAEQIGAADLTPDGAPAVAFTPAACSQAFINDFGGNGVLVTRKLRSGDAADYCTNRMVVPAGTNVQVTVTVAWVWKGQPYRHTITRIL